MNIYLVKRITPDVIEETKRIFNETLEGLETTRDINDILNPVLEYLDTLRNEIHICKRSMGWQLLFQHNEGLYEDNWISMTNYIKKVLDEGTYIMVDECNRPYTLKDLKEDLLSHKDGYTGATYKQYKREHGDYDYTCEDFEYISDNMRWSKTWFS